MGVKFGPSPEGRNVVWVCPYGSVREEEVTGDWRKLHSEERCDWYSLSNMIRIIKWTKRGVVYVPYIGTIWNVPCIGIFHLVHFTVCLIQWNALVVCVLCGCPCYQTVKRRQWIYRYISLKKVMLLKIEIRYFSYLLWVRLSAGAVLSMLFSSLYKSACTRGSEIRLIPWLARVIQGEVSVHIPFTENVTHTASWRDRQTDNWHTSSTYMLLVVVKPGLLFWFGKHLKEKVIGNKNVLFSRRLQN